MADNAGGGPLGVVAERLCVEPESTLLHDLVLRVRPARISSSHSIARGGRVVNYDGPALYRAQTLSKLNGYSILETKGYATPGSFGGWAGVDLEIPTITLELSVSESAQRACAVHQCMLIRFIRFESTVLKITD